jgi:hypothetical protein
MSNKEQVGPLKGSRKKRGPDDTLYCSFCGKSQDEVEMLIAGAGGTAHICNECVDICNEMIADRNRPTQHSQASRSSGNKSRE